MRMMMGLGSLLLLGGIVVTTIRVLAARRSLVARLASLVLAVVVFAYCAVVVFALIADNLDASVKTGGALSVVVFALIGTAAAASAPRRVRA